MKNYVITVASLIWVLAFTHFMFAQSGAALKGRVVDGNGDAIPGAEVLIAKKDVRFATEAVSDADGTFAFQNLPQGNYRITVSADTFGLIVQEVVISEDERIDLVLKPDAVAAEVSVTSSYLAGTPESLTEIPGSIERIDSQTLENSRVYNFSEVLRKVPGVNVRDEEGFGLRPNIGIRGTNPTRSTKVLLLEDGLPLSYATYGDNASYYHPPVERYESIEV